MKKNDTYNTKQRDNIYNEIIKYNKKFTVKDIYNQVKDNTGLTTVYRFVDKLVENGVLKKFVDDNNVVYYQYLESCDKSNHFYLMCSKCSKLIHVDCDCVKDLFIHIFDKHKFIPNGTQVVIDGVCKECNEGGIIL